MAGSDKQRIERRIQADPDRQERDGMQGDGSQGQEYGSRTAGVRSGEEVPRGGMNPELGDIDAQADPERASEGDDDALPGRVGGGLVGG